METAGLALGLISLATTFDTVLRCFEYIHFAKTFENDYEDCVLKLDNARLRLSRWGEAVGLHGVDEHTKSLRGTKIPEPDIPSAEKLLKSVLDEVKRVRNLSAKVSGPGSGDENAVLSEETDLSVAGQSIHEQMQKVIKNRRNKLSIRRKAKWVLYDREHFKGMIECISEKTKELQELFPAARSTEKALIDKEVVELTWGLKLLKDAIQGQDRTLATALDAILKPVAEKVENTVHGGIVGVMSASRSDIQQSFSSK
ncbi:prion-inhibition and propagation-domain-containing protein [Ilyonectria robusta]|uniref:prion-inhibition and propagation-domain-containing protein n=1 Tax=Ilyonectria robusta TaxID=1079257 RepID=UPI001E8CA980|nr:prion-inhibition and propagation-domain-containing protein [Ilyonectria robusta]KAH8651652.1 prion-inhibition and propagation-domain-containing protein [Ilyonectria robusta]